MRKIILFLGMMVLISSFVWANLETDLKSFWIHDTGYHTSTALNDSTNFNNISKSGTVTFDDTGIINEGTDTEGSGCFTMNNGAINKYHANSSSPRTWSFWIKYDILDSSYDYIWDELDNGGFARARIFPNTSLVWQIASGDRFSSPAQSTGIWYHNVISFDGSTVMYYYNGDNVANYTGNMGTNNNNNFRFGAVAEVAGCSNYADAVYDEIAIWQRALTQEEVNQLYNDGNGLQYPFVNTAPTISNINCISCNIPYGDNESPYTTSDTTPTFSFNTDINADCRIADEDWNYTAMGDNRNCTTTGTTNHICTLTVQDELIYSTDYVYISCANGFNGNESVNSSSGALQMDITDLEINTSRAIDRGIQNSVIWPGATIYSNQQVYLRDLNNNQVLATVDKVAVYGNQRWILNYNNESKLGLFNITPVVYVLDMVNISLTEIEQQTTELINSTKN